MAATSSAVSKGAIRKYAKSTGAKMMLFLGAGASHTLGFPIMNGFFEKAYPDLSSSLQKSIATDDLEFTLIRLFLHERKDKQLDLEEVVTFLDTARQLRSSVPQEEFVRLVALGALSLSHDGHSPGAFADWCNRYLAPAKKFAERLDGVIDKYRREIHRIFGRVDAEKAAKVWIPLVKMAQAHSRCIPLFTTNYDTSIESASSVRPDDLDFCDGFAERHGLRTRIWSMKNYFRRKSGLLLFKLHGSVNWYMKDGAIRFRPYDDCLSPTSGDSVIQLPTLRKGKIDQDQPHFSEMYEGLKAFLGSVTACVVIGYSFRDNEIRKYFEDVLKMRSDFRLIAVNPVDPKTDAEVNGSLLNLLKEFPKQVRRIEKKFGSELEGDECIRELSDSLGSVLKPI